MNLASSFVNGFVNAAFGQDKLLTDDGNKWLYKNKDHGIILFFIFVFLWLFLLSSRFIYCLTDPQGSSLEILQQFSQGRTILRLMDYFLGVGMLSAAASLGMILLWDVDGGLTQIDKYLYSSEDYIKVGLGLAH